MIVRRRQIVYAVLLAGSLSCTSSPPAAIPHDHLPWLEFTGVDARRTDVHTLSADASVTVSDGLTYAVSTVFHDAQRAVIRRVYEDRTVIQGVEGRYIWTFDGDAEAEAPPFVEEFVLGHQVHAQLLFFDRLHQIKELSRPARFGDQDCRALESGKDGETWSIFYVESGRPLGMEKESDTGPPIEFTFGDWREIQDLLLPFEVAIDDGERNFVYRYSSVRLNEGSLDGFRAPHGVLTDEQQLLRLHRIVMDAHFFGKAEQMTAIHGDSVAIVSDGDVYLMSGDEADATMRRIMATRDYTTYDDLIRPIVRISNDGTIGWVIAQISARGVRFDEGGVPGDSLSFVSAWIELYEKAEEEWRLTGNVSNFRTGRR